MRLTRIWALVTISTLAAACGSATSTPPGTATQPTTPSATATGAPETTLKPSEPAGDPELVGEVSLVDVVSPGKDLPERPFDDVVAHTIRDNEEWWAEEFPELYGTDYAPIAGGFFPAYEGRGDPIPGCPGPEPMTIAEIESFLALYCSSGDFFAYDDRSVGPLADLIANHGTVVIALILSHEWAHAIQPRAGVELDDLPSILSEQQADCFAGAWAKRSTVEGSDWIRLDTADIDAIVRFYGDVADPADTDPQGAHGHGSYLDRLGAFAVGFDAGPRQCVDLIDKPLALLADVARLSAPEAEAPTTTAECADDDCDPIDLYTAALNDHWGGTPISFRRGSVATGDSRCDDGVELVGGVTACPATRVVEIDVDPQASSGKPNGFATAVLLANAWSFLNSDDESGSPASQLDRWCDVGAWVGEAASTDGNTGLKATASDVDAGLRTIVATTDDLPLLLAANSYRRGVILGGC